MSTPTSRHLIRSIRPISSSKELVQRCIKRLRETNDGGDASLDKNNVTSFNGSTLATETVRAKVEGTPHVFPRMWVRPSRSENDVNDPSVQPGNRGDAVWFFPSDKCIVNSPRILYLHGGSYCWYSPITQSVANITTKLALQSGMPVLSIDYRMAPEFDVKAATEDAIEALSWIGDDNNAPKCRCSSCHALPTQDTTKKHTPIFICGDSAGGSLALLTFLQSDEHHRKLVSGICVFSPYNDLSSSLQSNRTRAWNEEKQTGDPVFSSGDSEEAIQKDHTSGVAQGEKIVPSGWALQDPRCSPVFSSDLGSLPRTRIHVGDAEVMLDESVVFAENAVQQHANDISLVIWEKMWHTWMYYSESCCYKPGETDDVLNEANEVLIDACDHFIKWAKEDTSLHS
eukprot:m.41762 g.41762  ORF g.41762 m.41762 type:complete len:399 (-) comp18907_c0_seq1:33-1229(-)